LSYLDEAQDRAHAALHGVITGIGGLLPSGGNVTDRKDVSARLHQWLAAHAPTLALVDPKTGKMAGAGAEPLGAGSFGMVFLARERDGEQRSLALKVPHGKNNVASLQEDCDKISFIFKAIEAGGNATMHGEHHVMHCVKAYIEADPPFIALEYAGISGQEAIVSELLSPDKIHGYFKQVVLALAAFNAAVPPQIHHDLKWTNTAIDANGCLKLSDLDTVFPGTHGVFENVTKWVPFSAAYAPPEIIEYIHAAELNSSALQMLGHATWTTTKADLVRMASAKPWKFHNFECGATEGAFPETPCPLAHSWDIYSAGMMAVSNLCGLDAYAYARRVMRPSEPEAQLKAVQQQHGLSRNAARQILGSVGGQEELQVRRLRRQLEVASEEMANLDKSGQLALDGTWWAWKEKLAYCMCLPNASIELLERMTSRNPAERPRPQELLESVLFRSVSTGCAADPPAEPVDKKFTECRNSA